MKVTDFGATVKGDETKLYTLTNKNGMEIAVSDYGATLVQVIVPDKEGKPCDVVLGYDEAAGYEEGDLFFGAIVGRSANRIGGASFELNGVTYQLEKNDNGNNLHSGMDFYNQRMWKVKETADDHITFELDSPGEGLEWDTTDIEDGIVRVKLSTSVDDIRADEEVTCEVFTIGGAQVGRFTCARKDIRRTLKQSGAAPGTYMVKTIQDSSTTTEKISIDY